MKNREGIYYWKCDRPFAFHSLNATSLERKNLLNDESLNKLLTRFFGNTSYKIKPSGSQGNHIAFIVDHAGKRFFLRIEDGPEGDNYMEVEAEVLARVRSTGVPTPVVHAVDATRTEYRFAYQLMDFIEFPDLNQLYKTQNLDISVLADAIGKCIAQYQQIQTKGYGLFDPKKLRDDKCLTGLHNSYSDYYYLNLDKHLDFLQSNAFLSHSERSRIEDVISQNAKYLNVSSGCLVHKDIALWNILGTSKEIKAIIDWDDTISGDPTDDISLLACFHSGGFINSVLAGYKKVRELPEDFLPRFWMHLLRNLIVKAVIRVGAGYFDLKDDFFLIGPGKSGKSLKQFTKHRIDLAVSGLQEKSIISDL